MKSSAKPKVEGFEAGKPIIEVMKRRGSILIREERCPSARSLARTSNILEKPRRDLQSLDEILETFAWNLHFRGNARVEIQDPTSLRVLFFTKMEKILEQAKT